MGKRVTIQQIAEMAGVSRGTVDRVLNHRSYVSEAVRARVDLTIVAPFYFILGLLAVYRTSIQSMQNGRAPFAACMIELVMRIAATVGLSGIIGYTSVCIASPLAWFGACALLIPVYYRMMKRPLASAS